MEKNYFFQEKTALEPKRKTINFITDIYIFKRTNI